MSTQPEAATHAPWGYVAEFDSVDALLAATERVRDAGFVKFDSFAPFPVHGLDEAMGLRPSRVPLVVLLGGIAGGSAALLMQWWMNARDYPYLISAKPLFGLPAAVPITFELTVLVAALGAFLGVWVGNRLPELYHPLFTDPRFRTLATTDGFYIAVQADDPKFDLSDTRAFLEGTGAVRVAPVEDS
jgi:Alternative complex III, ActD subunit